MSYEDIKDKLSSNSHFVVIHRRGWEDVKHKPLFRWNLEVGFTTFTDPSYYLWIKVDDNMLDDVINKFNLKEI